MYRIPSRGRRRSTREKLPRLEHRRRVVHIRVIRNLHPSLHDLLLHHNPRQFSSGNIIKNFQIIPKLNFFFIEI